PPRRRAPPPPPPRPPGTPRGSRAPPPSGRRRKAPSARAAARAFAERRSRGPCQICPVSPLRRPAFLSRGSQRQHADPEVSALPGSGKRRPRDVPDGGQLAALAEDTPRRRAADRLRSPSAVAGATLTSGLGRESSAAASWKVAP